MTAGLEPATCPQCGDALAPERAFCSGCGTPRANARPRRRRFGAPLAVALLAWLLLTAGLVVLGLALGLTTPTPPAVNVSPPPTAPAPG